VKPILFVMVKEPHPGRVKTRLGRDIGHVQAAWWYRHQVTRLLRRVNDPRWQTVLAVSPDREGLLSRVWGPRFARVAQGNGDLGLRMRRLLNSVPGKSLLIGSDIPGVTCGHIAGAFSKLAASDVVFGPSPDGGFWLVGAHSLPRTAFDGPRWSTRHALSDSIATLPGKRIAIVEALSDVDTVNDLAMTSVAGRDS